MAAKTKLLRNTMTGVIFPFSDTLEKQLWMEPYNPKEAVNEPTEKTESIKIISEEINKELTKEEVPFVEWEHRSDDGPVYRSLIKLANRKMITMDNINTFNPSFGDFKEKFNPVAVKAAISEFKIRALNGE